MNTQASLTAQRNVAAAPRQSLRSRIARQTLTALVLTGAFVTSAMAAITGTVFQDFNGNGVKDTAGGSVTTTDTGVAGVTVTAYGDNNTSCGTATTIAAGTYSITLTSTTGNCAGPNYRIEFTTLPANFFPTARSTDSSGGGTATSAGTATQFAANGATNVNLGINEACDYCQNNPPMAASIHFSGATTNPAAAVLPSTRAFSYLQSGGAIAPSATTPIVTQLGETGSLWGLAYIRQTKTLYSAAMLKRQIAMYESPAGTPRPGTIFKTVDPMGASTPSVFIDLGAAPYNVPVGTVVDNATRGLAAPGTPTNDVTTYAQVGKVSLGDIEATQDGRYLFVTNLANQTVYRITVDADNNPATPPAAADVVGFPMTPAKGVAACTNGNWRPWGLGIRKDGAVFAGGVCDGATTGAAADLQSRVYQLDTTTGNYTLVLSFGMTYARGLIHGSFPACSGNWQAWDDTETPIMCYAGPPLNPVNPQPILSDIQFDVDGSMVLGYIDRYGHQQMANNYMLTGTATVQNWSGGDTMRACASGATWILEGNVGCKSSAANSTNAQGPGGGEYYGGDNYAAFHEETGNGGLALLPGSGEVVTTAMDASHTAFGSGGVQRLNNTTGNFVQGFDLWQYTSAAPYGGPGSAVKSHGMGDVELLCDNPPIEIGNRVWKDSNGNGIQDPNEAGIAGVTVHLYAPDGSGPDGILGTADDVAGAGILLGTAVTDTVGEYYFSSAAGTNTANVIYNITKLLPNVTAYKLVLDNAADYTNAAKLLGSVATTPNVSGDSSNSPLTDVRDSDATTVGGFATIVFNTGNAGENNHGLDFGFVHLANISGSVFQDFNGNGVRDVAGGTITATDVGVPGVTVTAYGNNNAVCGTTTTDATGNYSLTLTSAAGDCAGPTYRIEFTTLPANYFPSARSTDSVGSGTTAGAGTTTQFATDGATDVNLGVNQACDHCQDNPMMVAAIYFGGAQTDAAASPLPSSRAFPYLSSGPAVMPSATTPIVTQLGQTGSMWGLAYVRQSKVLYSASMLKRNVAIYESPVGTPHPGAIFKIINPTTSPTTSLFIDLGAAPYNVPVGTVASTAARGITTPGTPSNDPTAYPQVGKVSLGDIEATLDGKYLFVTNLANQTVYRIEIDADNNPATPPAAAHVVGFPMTPATGVAACANGNWRPWGLGIRKDGAVFAGGVCDASSGTAADLQSRIYRLDTTTGNYSQVLSFGMTFARGAPVSYFGYPLCTVADGTWRPWSDIDAPTYCDAAHTATANPQPILSDIQFDVDGSMILGYIDRYAHQQNALNYQVAGTNVIAPFSAGDILRACASGATWILEGSAGCASKAANGEGPGGGEYYFSDTLVPVHNETSNGGLALLPGSDQVAMTAMDPDAAVSSGGVRWLSNITGDGVRGFDLYTDGLTAPIGGPGNALKAHGMGDIELLCDNPPIEIGNRVWNDANSNGIQDPNEPSIAGVTVRLYAPDGSGPDGIPGTVDDVAGAGILLGTAVTDAAGEYYFSSATGTSTVNVIYNIAGLLPNVAGYRIAVNNPADYTNATKLLGLGATIPNAGGDTSNNPVSDVRDSDATNVGGFATIVFNTGNAGENNHGLDFGFMVAPLDPHSIGNRVWFDTNNNGVLDAGELPAPGVSVSLFASDASGNATGAALGTVNTDAAGRYRFDGLSPGAFVVVVNATNWGAGGALRGYASSGTTVDSATNTVDSKDNGVDSLTPATNGIKSGKITVGAGSSGMPTGEDQTAPAPSSVTGVGGDPGDTANNLTIDFGFYKVAVGNQLWVEAGGSPTTFTSGTDTTPPAVQGRTVNLIDTATNAIVGSATTNASGVYVIDSTTAGNPIDVTKTYKVAVPMPAAYAPIGAGTALTDNNNQAPTAVVSPPYGAGSFLETGSFTLVPGATSSGQVVTNATGVTTQPTLDIGLQQAYSIGNRVWLDANNNGVMDGGEAAAPNVSVSVFAATAAGAPTGAAIATVTTDSNGRYRFDGLLAGDYVVAVNASNWAPAGALRGYASSGTTANSTTNTVDARDNGVDSLTPATTGILSGKITVGAATTFPSAEDQTAPNAPGAIGGAGGDAGDAANNLTIDFGFYKVTVGDQLWVEAGGSATTFTSGTDLTPAVVQSKPMWLLDVGSNTVVASGTTDSGGVYVIDSTPTGNPLDTTKTYKVVTVLPPNFVPLNAGAALTNNNNQAPTVVANPTYNAGAAGPGKYLETGTFTLVPGATSNGQVVTLATGVTAQPTLDIGVQPVYSLGDRVWIDNGGSTFVAANVGNGVQDANEPGLNGVTVALLDGTGAQLYRDNATGVVSTTSAGGTALTTVTATLSGTPGLYSFDTLPAGNYQVKFTLPPNYQWTTTGAGNTSTDSDALFGASRTAATATSAVVALGAASTAGTNGNPLTLSDPKVDAGVVPLLSLGDRVWSDTNGNGVQDAGEPGLNGVTVTLLNGSGAPLYRQADGSVSTTVSATPLTVATSTQAGQLGSYQFAQLPPGDYQVQFTLPAGGYRWSPSDVVGAPSNDSLDSDAVATTPGAPSAKTATITLTAVVPDLATPANPLGVSNPTVDAGIVPVFSIGNRVWFDSNNDGLLNGAEVGTPGVSVSLFTSDASGNATGAALTTLTTDSTGRYRFDGVTAGDYVVVVNATNWATGGVLRGYASSGTTVDSATNAVDSKDNGIDSLTPASVGIKSGKITVNTSVTLPTAEDQVAPNVAGAIGGTAGDAGDAANNLTIDFGFYRLTLGDTVWRDDGAGTAANYNNGLKDAGEAGLPGVRVELLKGAAVAAVTYTDASGYYLFDQASSSAGVTDLATANAAKTGNPLVAGVDYSVRIPAAQPPLTNLKSSVAPASQPVPGVVGNATNDDGDKGTGVADAFANATTTAAFTLAASTTGAAVNANNTFGTAQDGNATNGTSHKPDVDLGFVPTYALGNRVWFDTNNDGMMNAGELAIDGVLVELTNSAGAKLYRTSATDNTPTTTVTAGLAIEQVTANGGYYLLDTLPAGTFRARVAASNWAAAGVLAGYASSTSATNAAANFAAADNNKDHGTDPANAAAYTSGVSSADIALGPLAVGTGDTTEIAPVGTPPASLSGDANDNLTIDFGFYRLSIGNLVWSDSGSGGGVYNDGIRNGTEPGLDGVTVQLVDSNSNVVAQALTSGGGLYSFTQLTSVPAVGTAGTPNGQPILPGNYTINIPPNQTPIAGSTSSADTAGGLAVADSQDNGVGIALTTAATTSSAITLAPGATAQGSTPTNANGTTDQPRADFGFAPGFAIGNRVWFDTNNNGVIDAGEAMIPNVIVELLDSTSTVIQTKASGPTGEYIFESLGTGNYTVRIAKENWTGLTAAQVTNAGNPAGVAAGQKPLAGYNNSTGAGALTGTTTTDATDKGVDAADPTVAGISSATITLGAGLQPLNESATGDNDGVGTTTSIDANNNMTIDFGFYKLSVGDLVWKDDGNAGATPGSINNGLFDAGEAGIPGVRVELYKGTTLVAVTTTGSNGDYLFTQGTDGTGVANGKPLVPGTDYQVRIPQATASVNTPLINLLSSAAAAASETTPLGVNSDDSGVGVAAANAGITPSVNFTLGAGAASGVNSIPTNATGTTAQPNVDFGFAPSYSLGNRVWVDTNNNGIIDGAEAGLIGVTVTLLDGTGTPVPGVATQTTDGSGYYRFDNLPAGNYRVEIAPPPVNGVNYVSSTGQNASANGPYEAGLTSAATSTNNKDHGTQATPTTIRSGVIVVGPTSLVTGDGDGGATGVGAPGPNGDAFDVLTVDFGIFLPAKLGNLVWFDANKDGKADSNEPGLNGAIVRLFDVAGVEVARQITRDRPVGVSTGQAGPGWYQFDYVIPGQYRVVMEKPGMMTTTAGTPAVSTGSPPETNNSQLPPNIIVGSTGLVTVAAGDNNPQLDAGFVEIPPIPTLSELMKLLLAMMMLSIGAVGLGARRA